MESHHAPGQDGIGAAGPKDDRGASQEGLVDLGATAEQVLNADAMVLGSFVVCVCCAYGFVRYACLCALCFVSAVEE